jgi:hypothetical protein
MKEDVIKITLVGMQLKVFADLTQLSVFPILMIFRSGATPK